jgi:hypothetical protein
MSPELSAFITANGTVLILVVGALIAVGLVQWRKVRVGEQEHEYKKALLDKGTPPEEIERVAAKSGRPVRRGLLEQFGALSGGGKAGVVIALIVVISVVTGSISSVMHSQTFAESVRQQAARSAESPSPSSTPAVGPFDTIRGNIFYLDLQPVANQKLTDVTGENGHSFAALPQKRREFGGVPFQVGPGYVRLKGTNRPKLPQEVTDVCVGLKFDKLHILHGTEYGAHNKFHVSDGTEIGHYLVRYADEKEETIPVVYGKDVRDSWNWDRSQPVSRGKVAWTGSSPGASKEGVFLRLYLTSWDNPRPDKEVTHLDFVSAGDTHASPFCVALTAERAVK